MLLSRKNLLRILLNTLLGLILALVWLKFTNLGEVTKRLGTVQLKFIALFFVFFLTSTTIRATRLRLLLIKYPLDIKELIPLNLLSQFLSFIVPIRAGEIARSIYLTDRLSKKDTGLVFAKSLVWVFLDRFLDFWAFIALVSILIFIVPNNLPGKTHQLLLILTLGFTVAALLMIFASKLARKLLEGFSRLLIFKRLRVIFLKFSLAIAEEFSLLRRPPKEFAGLLFLTLLAVISDTLIWFFTLLSLGVNLGPFKTLLGSSLTILTFVIPAAPGYVGSAEASGLAIFSGVLGLNSNLASSAVILNHLLTAITLPVFGITSIYFLKFDLNLVWKKLSSRGR